MKANEGLSMNVQGQRVVVPREESVVYDVGDVSVACDVEGCY